MATLLEVPVAGLTGKPQRKAVVSAPLSSRKLATGTSTQKQLREQRRFEEKIRRRFSQARDTLTNLGIICRSRMIFQESFYTQEGFLEMNLEQLLNFYIYNLGKDPRRLIPDIIRKPMLSIWRRRFEWKKERKLQNEPSNNLPNTQQ